MNGSFADLEFRIGAHRDYHPESITLGTTLRELGSTPHGG